MYGISYIDDETIRECKKQFKSIYGLFPHIIGAADDTSCVIASCSFPDGVFYFRITENSVSEAFISPEEANSGRHNPAMLHPTH